VDDSALDLMAEGHTDHEGRDPSARFLACDDDLVLDSVGLVGIVPGFFLALKASWLNPIESTQVPEINLGHVEAQATASTLWLISSEIC